MDSDSTNDKVVLNRIVSLKQDSGKSWDSPHIQHIFLSSCEFWDIVRGGKYGKNKAMRHADSRTQVSRLRSAHWSIIEGRLWGDKKRPILVGTILICRVTRLINIDKLSHTGSNKDIISDVQFYSSSLVCIYTCLESLISYQKALIIKILSSTWCNGEKKVPSRDSSVSSKKEKV